MTILKRVLGAYRENGYVVYDDTGRALVIDPGDEPEQLISLLREYDLQVEAIVLTHAHFDHLMAVKDIQEATGAPLYLHEIDACILNNSAYTLVSLPYTLTPDRLLHDQDTITVGKMIFTVLHTPGHTGGSICLLCEDVLFAGDTLFAGGVGRVDLPGADPRAQGETLKRLVALPDSLRVLCGHGPETTLGIEKQTNPFMVGL